MEAMEEYELEHELPHSILAQRPELDEGQQRLWDMFMLLHRRRQHSMEGPEPLSLREVGYAAQFSREDSWDFIYVIDQMDEVFMNYVREQQEQQRQKAKK